MGSQELWHPCRIDDNEIYLSSLENGIYIGLSILCSILAISGNGLVVFLLYKKQSLRNVSNIFLCSLAVADLWAGLVPIHINASVVWLGVCLECNTLTKINDFLAVHSLVITTLNLCTVSIDRFIAVKRPLRYPSIMTPTTVRQTLLVIWITSIVLAIPMTCICDDNILIYWFFISISTILISLLVVLYCYSVILKCSSAQQQRIIPMMHLQPHNSRNGLQLGVIKSRKAMTRFLAIMFLLLIAFLPNLICALVIVIPFENCPSAVKAILKEWAWCLICINLSPCLNPCIFAFGNKQFRSAFKSIIKRENGSNMPGSNGAARQIISFIQ